MSEQDSTSREQQNQSWAKFVERRRGSAIRDGQNPNYTPNGDAAHSETREHLPSTMTPGSKINEVALDDLVMDSMLQTLARSEQDESKFTNSLINKLTSDPNSPLGIATRENKVVPVDVIVPVELEPANRDQSITIPAKADSRKTTLMVVAACCVALIAIPVGIAVVSSMNSKPGVVENDNPPKVSDSFESNESSIAVENQKQKSDSNNLQRGNTNVTDVVPQKNAPSGLPAQPGLVPRSKRDSAPAVANSKSQVDPSKQELPQSSPDQPKLAKQPSQVPREEEATESPVQWVSPRIVDTKDAVWATRHSADLKHARSLKSGVVKIETPRGVQVELKGPTRFKFPSPEKIELTSGQLSANVGKRGKGFTVMTPGSKIVDLGTAFDVNVSTRGDSRIFVSQGVVEVEPLTRKPSRKWRQQAEQTSFVSRTGRNADWLLSIRFDENGFGTVEFNGEVLPQFVTQQEAPRVLEQIRSTIGSKFKSASPYLKNPIRGACCIDSSTHSFDRSSRFDSMCRRTLFELEKLDSKKLSQSEFESAKSAVEKKLQMIRKQMEQHAKGGNAMSMVQVDFGAGGMSATVRFPGQNSTTGSQSTNPVVQSIARKTDQVLNHLIATEGKRNRPSGFGFSTVPGGVAGMPSFIPNMLNGGKPSELATFKTKPLLQKQNEEQLQQSLYHSAPEVRGFSDQQIRSLIKRYTRTASPRAQIRSIMQRVNMQQANPAVRNPRAPTEEPVKQLIATRPDLQGLPFVMDQHCRLGGSDAAALGTVSTKLGAAISRFNVFGSLPEMGVDQKKFADMTGMSQMRHQSISRSISQINSSCKNDSKKVSGYVQMLQTERPQLRYELINQLASIPTKESTQQLAARAVFDFSPEVRNAATQVLAKRKQADYQSLLIKSLEYPWAPVAEHAAEALVRLDDKTAVGELVELLDRPDPSLPFKNKNGAPAIREVVAINHLKNCLTCHAPSTSEDDSVLGLMPSPGERLPNQYYQSQSGGFVRADVTYLTQDFSVVQPVANEKIWPKLQRFDYVVRERPLTKREVAILAPKSEQKPNRHRAAVIFALRKLTGQSPRKNDKATWKEILAQKRP